MSDVTPHAYPILFIRETTRGWERAERRRGGDRQHPPLDIGVGVGDATGGWRPGFIAPDVVRIALRLVRLLPAATAAPAPQPLAGVLLLAPHATRSSGPPPRAFATPRTRLEDPRIGRTQPRRRARSNAGRPRL